MKTTANAGRGRDADVLKRCKSLTMESTGGDAEAKFLASIVLAIMVGGRVTVEPKNRETVIMVFPGPEADLPATDANPREGTERAEGVHS